MVDAFDCSLYPNAVTNYEIKTIQVGWVIRKLATDVVSQRIEIGHQQFSGRDSSRHLCFGDVYIQRQTKKIYSLNHIDTNLSDLI